MVGIAIVHQVPQLNLRIGNADFHQAVCNNNLECIRRHCPIGRTIYLAQVSWYIDDGYAYIDDGYVQIEEINHVPPLLVGLGWLGGIAFLKLIQNVDALPILSSQPLHIPPSLPQPM